MKEPFWGTVFLRVDLPDAISEVPLTDLALRPTTATPTGLEISSHAWSRIAELKLDVEEVMAAVDEPEHDVPFKGRRLATKGRVTVWYDWLADGRKIACTVLWAGRETDYRVWADGADPLVVVPEAGTEPVEEPTGPPSAMNEIFLSQLELWGGVRGRLVNGYVHVVLNGVQLRVRPAGHPVETPAAVADKAYALLGVTPETFWSRTTRLRPPRERLFAPRAKAPVVATPRRVVANGRTPVPETEAFRFAVAAAVDAAGQPCAKPGAKAGRKRRKLSGRAAQILGYFRERPGAILDMADVADEIEADIQAVRLGCSALCRAGYLQRVRRGGYRYIDTSASDDEQLLASINEELLETNDPLRRVELIQERIELMAQLDEGPVAGTAVRTVPARRRFGMADSDYDDTLDALMALVAPDGVKACHADAVDRWLDLTRDLIEELSTPC